MTKLRPSLSEYWSNESKIKEARQIFFAKGVIRRELIIDDLAFAWLRCKYKGISSTAAPIQTSSKSVRQSMKKHNKAASIFNEVWIGYFDQNGILKYHSGSESLGHKFESYVFTEALAGYNGIGACIENRSLSMTTGFEHYNNAFCDYISIGMPFEDYIVGFIIPIQIAEDELIDKLMSHSYEFFRALETNSLHHVTYDLHFFRQEIDVYKSCYMTFLKLSRMYAYLMIRGEQFLDAYELAQMIHDQSVRRNDSFIHLSEKDHLNGHSYEVINMDFKGTLLIEDVNWLPIDIQEKINQIIECKLINSKLENALNKSDLAIIIFEKKTSAINDAQPDLYGPLHENMNKALLCIPSFHKIGRPFKAYLYEEFEKICFKRGYRVVHLSEAVLKLLTIYQWPKGYHELRYLADYISAQSFEGDEVPLSALPKYIIQIGEHLDEDLTLKHAEHLWLEKVLALCDGNIKKAAMHLGITRTTLYKKMDEYKINV